MVGPLSLISAALNCMPRVSVTDIKYCAIRRDVSHLTSPWLPSDAHVLYGDDGRANCLRTTDVAPLLFCVTS